METESFESSNEDAIKVNVIPIVPTPTKQDKKAALRMGTMAQIEE